MGIISKVFGSTSAPKEEPVSSMYPFEVVTWNVMYDDISELIATLQKDGELTGISANVFLNCKIEPEPKNQVDKNALKVYAKIGRKKALYWVGYVPSNLTSFVRKDMEKVSSGEYYFSLRFMYNVMEGSHFTLGMHKSKYGTE